MSAAPADPAPASGRPPLARLLLALIVGQTGLHAAMTGLRMAAPLDALALGASTWRVGVLMGLFAAAGVALALAAGRMADRYGYHRPLRLAVALACGGLLLAAASTLAGGGWRFALLALAAILAGAGANLGLIVVQRTGGLLARSAVERVRIFSWLGIAPSFASVVGPVTAGVLIDEAGFGVAYLALLVLPLASLWSARGVPPQPLPARPAERRPAWELLRLPGMKRLLLINWLLSMGWDVHSFAVPILGHGLGFSATTIGLVLGSFTLAVTGVRVLIPLLAERLRETTVLRGAMLGAAAVFALYPFAGTPLSMAACALALGVLLGSVQPMMLSLLHHVTPDDRHGEALAVRSMTINAASAVMPLLFGAAGAAVGAAALFWVVGAAIGAGSTVVRRLETTG
ncbi:MAG: MFS transporter [Rubrivivax sp.]